MSGLARSDRGEPIFSFFARKFSVGGLHHRMPLDDESSTPLKANLCPSPCTWLKMGIVRDGRSLILAPLLVSAWGASPQAGEPKPIALYQTGDKPETSPLSHTRQLCR